MTRMPRINPSRRENNVAVPAVMDDAGLGAGQIRMIRVIR